MIKVLPGNIANLIAAGEVVGRPASVVKELMENSIDAGCSSVSVIVLDAGRTLVQVIDDGCGMSAGDAALCFERHATSKISSAEDLEKILTYGFRGEALASIAAVAQVTLKTRRSEDAAGVQIEVADSKILSQKAVATPKGCNIAVSNLFYNVPARRKFLKSDASEMRQIEQAFLRVALSHTGKAFTLKHNGKDLYNIRPAASLKQRISDLCGRATADALVGIATETDIVKISGFVGSPAEARKTAGNQFFFINGRYFRSPYLHKAVCRPYENLVREGYTPSYFIFLECDPTTVDVNIHPQKTEIKFTEEHIIFDILSACVREALGRGAFAPTIDFESGEVLDFPVMGQPLSPEADGGSPAGRQAGAWSGAAQRTTDYSPLLSGFEKGGRSVGADFWSGREGGFDGLGTTEQNGLGTPDQNCFDTPEQNSFDTTEQNGPGGAPVGGDLYGGLTTPHYGYGLGDDDGYSANVIVTGRLIVAPVREGLAIIDIRKGQEALLYHKYFEFLSQEKFISQRSLYPQQVSLSHNIYSIILENLDKVSQLGFDIRDFGDDTIIAYAVPDGFPAEEEALRDAMDNLASSLQDEPEGENIRSYASTLAASAAKRLSRNLNPVQARMLADDILALRATYGTDLATRCIAIISNEELEKRI